MNQRQRFIRKIVYAVTIAVLLLPLSWLSQPATTESEGGVLARMREANRLSQADLGDIDPTSETIKLATLGMRGLAANLLWDKANQYMKEEDWTNLSATLEQIARLQPNFVSVWAFQGWNLSYNVSVEFDDYHDRYRWVIKGVDFLKRGTEYNHDEPRLLTDIGWTIANKIGTADEHVQYRRLFREDDDFNGSRPLAQRDNWLVGREWLGKADEVVAQGRAVKGNSPLLFYSRPAMCLINYAEALEEEGRFGEVAKNAWLKAADGWTELGNRDLPTQYGQFIRMSDKEEFDRRAREAIDELERLAPGLRKQLAAERVAALDEKERRAYETPRSLRTKEQDKLAYEIGDKLVVSHMDVAERLTGENHSRAFELAEEAGEAEAVSQMIGTQRETVNFENWRLRCRFEPEDDTLAARKAMYDGDKAFNAAQLPPAGEFYLEGIQKWRKVLDKYPELLKDSLITEDLMTSINRYRNILHQLAEEFPAPFILQDVIDADAASKARGLPATKDSTKDEGKDEKASSDGAPEQPADEAKPTETPSAPQASDDKSPADARSADTQPTDPTSPQPKPADK